MAVANTSSDYYRVFKRQKRYPQTPPLDDSYAPRMMTMASPAQLTPPTLSSAIVSDRSQSSVSSPQGQAEPEWASPVQSFKAYLDQLGKSPEQQQHLDDSNNSNNNDYYVTRKSRKRNSSSPFASLFSIGKNTASDTTATITPGSPKRKRKVFPLVVATQPRTQHAKCEKLSAVSNNNNSSTSDAADLKIGYVSFPAIDDHEDEDESR